MIQSGMRAEPLLERLARDGAWKKYRHCRARNAAFGPCGRRFPREAGAVGAWRRNTDEQPSWGSLAESALRPLIGVRDRAIPAIIGSHHQSGDQTAWRLNGGMRTMDRAGQAGKVKREPDDRSRGDKGVGRRNKGALIQE